MFENISALNLKMYKKSGLLKTHFVLKNLIYINVLKFKRTKPQYLGHQSSLELDFEDHCL
jgi:hypothetical protein